ncbi:MAG: DUF47 family protein [Rikenellaceae bacterium]|jgi:uncharacterized protein Yka (UPF0111/DUF47 family)|nr:DUF47 family protein [Rikenellaceae bacterium]
MSYNISRLFQFFLPNDGKFLPLLRDQVDDIVKGADLLIEFTHTTEHEKRKQLYTQIKQVEHHCDGITDEILDELNQTFITPFDHEDIHTLTSQLNDVLDLINGSAKRTVLYQPREMPEEMRIMAQHIKDSAVCIQIAINELKKVKRDPSVVREQCRRLHEMDVYHIAIWAGL